MILIAESGSTKCDWVLLNSKGVEKDRFRTMGFNPYFHSQTLINDVLSSKREVANCKDQITQVWFYGAGCSTNELKQVVKNALDQIFQKSKNSVGHDLEAAAYALYEKKPIIVGILGTGSNCCVFDGKTISLATPSLGYVLGDEGSASFIGKQLVADFLYGNMPNELMTEFKNTYKQTKDDVVKAVYHKPNANVYLASFAPFADKHISHSYMANIVSIAFNNFIDTHVSKFPNSHQMPVSFVGSVAKSFEHILKDCLNRKGYKFGQILAKPIDNLVNYHAEKFRD
ncbi:MAG: ATPase [Salibacteraceae bacterium]